jgi:hypothetical protein
MSAGALPKLAGFTGALVLLVGGGALAGNLIDPVPPSGAGHAKRMPMRGEHTSVAMGVRGLGVAEHGLRLVVERTTFTRGREEQLRFRVVDRRGVTVRDFDVERTKRMHLIVVRRDMTGFQHLHPVEDAGGTWTTSLRLADAGTYRMFADFSHDERPTTLASDLSVDGEFSQHPLPAPASEASAGGGYDVGLVAAKPGALSFTVTHNGRAVQTQPYLGAGGHLVALREGDLAFLHVHPTEGLTFEATFPTPGRYRLFLQFKVDGKLHVAAFTRVVI